MSTVRLAHIPRPLEMLVSRRPLHARGSHGQLEKRWGLAVSVANGENLDGLEAGPLDLELERDLLARR